MYKMNKIVTKGANWNFDHDDDDEKTHSVNLF